MINLMANQYGLEVLSLLNRLDYTTLEKKKKKKKNISILHK